MATSYTSLLGLALPVTGELSGTWGDTVNNYITSYVDAAVAGVQIISGSQTAVTLSVTNGSSLVQVGAGATGSAQYGIIRCSGNPASLLTITAPAASKSYLIINATSTSQSVKIVGTGPTTGVTLVSGESAVVAWNGTDFIKVSSSAVDGVSTFSAGTTGFTPSTATSGAVTLAGTLATTNGGTGLTSFTANGVVYASSSSALTTGSALTFDGTSLGVGIAPAAKLDVSGVSGGIVYFRGTGDAYQEIAGGGRTPGTGSLLVGQGNAGEAYLWNRFNSYTAFGVNNSEQMRLTSTGLGIGTSSPSYKLDVNTGQIRAQESGTGSGDGSLIGATVSANGNAGVLFQTNSVSRWNLTTQGTAGANLRIYNYTLASTVATFDSSGNLGLGVTPSAWATFKVMQIGNGTADTFIAVSGNQGDFGVNAYYNAGWKYQTSSVAASRYEQSSGVHQWFTAPSGTAGNAISFTQAMTLSSGGDLFLGATGAAFAERFRMNGAYAVFDDASYTGLIGRGSALGTGTASDFAIRSSNALAFLTGGATERARIDSSGSFLVGRTTSVASELLCVEGSVNAAFLARLRATNATSPFGLFVSYTAAAPNGTSNQFLRCDDNAATRAEIRSNGGLANYSANDVNLSDRREKTNFAPAKSYLDTICAIPVQTFNYIDQSADDPGLTLGVVAQDVQAVAPELVMESNWGTADNPKIRLSVYQTDLQYALMKALQELKAEFDAYKATHP